MGLVGRVLQFLRTEVDGEQAADVQLDPGGGANLTAENFAPAGDDAQPMAGDIAITVSSGGREHVVGYIDPANAGVAGPGEKRLYARDSSGAVVGVLYMKDDGTIEAGLNPTDAAALASKTQEALDKIFAALDAFALAVPAPTDGGAALQTAFKGVWGTPAPTTPVPEVASQTLKIEP